MKSWKGHISRKHERGRSNWDSSSGAKLSLVQIHLTSSLSNIPESKGVDVDPDTEPEPDGDDSGDTDEEHDEVGQQEFKLGCG